MNSLIIWYPISGYEGAYEISNTGQVKSLARLCNNRWGEESKPIKERLLKHGNTKQGYCQILLSKDSKTTKFFIHRLVASAFLENPLKLPQVNHIDGVKNNNHLQNLEWVTSSKNCKHALINKLYENTKGETHRWAKLKEEDIVEIRKQVSLGVWHKTLAEHYGVQRQAITKIVNNQRWKHVI